MKTVMTISILMRSMMITKRIMIWRVVVGGVIATGCCIISPLKRPSEYG